MSVFFFRKFRKKLKKGIIQEILKSEVKQKNFSQTLLFRWARGDSKLVRHFDRSIPNSSDIHN